MTHQQCTDAAELYALGTLEEAERAAMDEHLRACWSCAQYVAAAENDVATIASMEPMHAVPPDLAARVGRLFTTKRRFPPLPAAVAAALIVGLLPSLFFLFEARATRDAMLAQNAAVERIMSQPHRIANFQTVPPATTAQVAYAANGSWYVVLVAGASKPLSVAWMHGGERTMLGEAIPRGDLAMLYLPKSHRMDRLALMDGNRIVGQATLSWEKRLPNRQGGRSS